MTKRKLGWFLGTSFAVLSFLGIAYGIGRIENIALTENQVQTMIDSRLPLSKGDVTVKNIQIQFLPGVIQLSFEAEGKKLKQNFSVAAQSTGELFYNNLDGTFHFHPHDIKVEKITFRDGEISEKVEKFIDHWVDSKKLTQNKEIVSAKTEEWVHSLIMSTVTWTLKKIPVYKLPDTIKGNAVRMTLKSVEIDEGKVTAHLSFWQLTKMIGIYCLVFITAIGMLGAFIMFPKLGMTALILGSFGDS